MREKPHAQTVAFPAARRSPVQGDQGQLKIPMGVLGGTSTRRQDPQRRPVIVVKFATEDMLLIGRMHAAVVHMFRILKLHPGVGMGEVRSQLGAIAPSGFHDDSEGPPMRPRQPTAAETSLMDATFAVLVGYWKVDDLGAKLVMGRAIGTPWKALAVEDPKRRCRAMLSYMRNNSLFQMARSGEGRRVIELLDKIALDRLDRKRD